MIINLGPSAPPVPQRRPAQRFAAAPGLAISPQMQQIHAAYQARINELAAQLQAAGAMIQKLRAALAASRGAPRGVPVAMAAPAPVPTPAPAPAPAPSPEAKAFYGDHMSVQHPHDFADLDSAESDLGLE